MLKGTPPPKKSPQQTKGWQIKDLTTTKSWIPTIIITTTILTVVKPEARDLLIAVDCYNFLQRLVQNVPILAYPRLGPCVSVCLSVSVSLLISPSLTRSPSLSLSLSLSLTHTHTYTHTVSGIYTVTGKNPQRLIKAHLCCVQNDADSIPPPRPKLLPRAVAVYNQVTSYCTLGLQSLLHRPWACGVRAANLILCHLPLLEGVLLLELKASHLYVANALYRACITCWRLKLTDMGSRRGELSGGPGKGLYIDGYYV